MLITNIQHPSAYTGRALMDSAIFASITIHYWAQDR